jgi:hypothetical protein
VSPCRLVHLTWAGVVFKARERRPDGTGDAILGYKSRDLVRRDGQQCQIARVNPVRQLPIPRAKPGRERSAKHSKQPHQRSVTAKGTLLIRRMQFC